MDFRGDAFRIRVNGIFTLSRVAFAAACSERLLPNYDAFSREVNWGNLLVLREAIDEVWRVLEEGTYNLNKISEMIDRCEENIPDTENFNSILTSAALDAGTAVVETLKCCLDGDAEHVVDVVSFCLDTVDMYIREQYEPQFEIDEESVANDHPLMKAELTHLMTDLTLLEALSIFDVDFVRNFRRMAIARGSSILKQ